MGLGSRCGTTGTFKIEAPYARGMYEMYLKVRSTGKIRDYNNAHGIPTKRGGEWTSKTVSDFLRNPMNKGDYRYNYRESARGRKKPEDEVIYQEGVFEPLVDPEMWERVNRIMDDNASKRNTGGLHPIMKNCNVFAGLIQLCRMQLRISGREKGSPPEERFCSVYVRMHFKISQDTLSCPECQRSTDWSLCDQLHFCHGARNQGTI